ncbi:MAG: metal-sulfur cluster assembly factor [Fervidicoccaceae archaeon]|jgi:metal-sulfur cluster biosynthetic enzyme
MNEEELEKKIIEALRQVYDPEIPVSVYDLGLVYELRINENGEVFIRLGLTTPFCPIMTELASAVEDEITKRVPEAKNVKVELDLSTPWSPKMITKEGREQLKAIYGYDIVEEMLKKEQEQSNI